MQSNSRGWLPTPPVTPSLEGTNVFGCSEQQKQQQHRVNGQFIFVKVPKSHHTLQQRSFTVGPFPQIPHRDAALEEENMHLIHRLESELQRTTAEVEDYKNRYDMLHQEMRNAAAEIAEEQQKWRSALQSSKLAQERQEQECARIKAELELSRQKAKDSELALKAAEIECSLFKTTSVFTTRIDQMERDLRADIALLRRNLSLGDCAN